MYIVFELQLLQIVVSIKAKNFWYKLGLDQKLKLKFL